MSDATDRICRTWPVLVRVAVPVLGSVSVRTLQRLHQLHGLPLSGGGHGRPVMAERQALLKRLREIAAE